MKRWKRKTAVASAVVSLVMVATVVAAATPAGRSALGAAGGAITSAISGTRPMVDANAGGGGGSGTTLGPIVLSVGPKATLTGKLTANVQVAVTCGPFFQDQYGSANVQLSEAAGHTVAQAYGNLNSLPCDGNTYTLTVTVTAQNVPLRPGSGVVSVYANACGADQFGNYECQNGSVSANVAIKK